jgi:hypothetical protein
MAVGGPFVDCGVRTLPTVRSTAHASIAPPQGYIIAASISRNTSHLDRSSRRE